MSALGYGVTLFVAPNAVAPGRLISMTARSVTGSPAPFTVQIYDVGYHKLVAQCSNAEFCSISVSNPIGPAYSLTEQYQAFIDVPCTGLCSVQMPTSPQAASPVEAGTWLSTSLAASHRYAAPGEGVTLTATTNAPNQLTSIGLTIIDLGTGAVVADCAQGAQLGVNRCSVSLSNQSGRHTYQAVAQNPANPATIDETHVASAARVVTWAPATTVMGRVSMAATRDLTAAVAQYFSSNAALAPGSQSAGAPRPVTVEQARAEAARAPSTYVSTAGAANTGAGDPVAAVSSPITDSQCEASAAAGTESGYVRDHFNWCRIESWVVYRVFTVSSVPVIDTSSYFAFQTDTLGFTSSVSRQVQFTQIVPTSVATGVFGQSAAKTATVREVLECAGSPTSSQCPSQSTPTRAFSSFSPVYFSFVSDPSSGSTPDNIANGVFKLHIMMTVLGSPVDARSPANSIRCDSATYITTARAPGCIFDRVKSFVQFDAGTNSAEREAAEHIAWAQTRPASTLPKVAGKVIAGAPGAAPLHRRYPVTKTFKNRVQKVCQTQYPKYSAQLLECDEYPFNSTEEGVANGLYNWSACTIPKADNKAGGDDLIRYYTDDRVLNGDPFNVKVVNYDGSIPCRHSP